MKAQVFLELVGVMLEVQQDYFKSRLQSDLIKAKELERRVRAVVKEGHLEADDVHNPTPGPSPKNGEGGQFNLFEEGCDGEKDHS
jgi:hypothetical protein